jgi:hypothetical protein
MQLTEKEIYKIETYIEEWIKDEEKNEEIYKQKIDEILENTIEHKREKIFLIRIG